MKRLHRDDPNRSDPWWLVKYVLLAAAEGVVAGWTFLLILLYMDIGGLGTLVHGAAGPMALVILLMSFGTTFGFVGIAWRVMVLLPEE
jgi:polyferredoxin